GAVARQGADEQSAHHRHRRHLLEAIMSANLLSVSRRSRVAAPVVLVGAVLLMQAATVHAQIDPTLFLKRYLSTTPGGPGPNIILAVDTGNRMQRDAPTDPSCLASAGNPAACTATVMNQTSNYYDPFLYVRGTNAVAENTIGVTALNTTANYRRRYDNMTLAASGNPDKFNITHLTTTTDQGGSQYTYFDAPTRLAIARAAMYQAVKQNQAIARFGLLKMRQTNPTVAAVGNSGPVVDADNLQNVAGSTEVNGGKWNVSRPTVGANNGVANSNTAVIVQADA